MVKSPKIAKIPEVLVSFLESINLILPNQNLLNIFFFLFYAIFFQKKINKIWLSFYRFLFLRKKKQKKTKNEIRLPFYRFSFYVQTNTKNEKTKNDFRFIFYVRENTKNKKQKSASVLSFFLLSTNKHIKRKNGNRLPFYRFLGFWKNRHKKRKT